MKCTAKVRVRVRHLFGCLSVSCPGSAGGLVSYFGCVMKALSVHQPYAELIAMGVKSVELRSWETRYRGPLLICASRRADDPEKWLQEPVLRRCAELGVNLRGLPSGVAVCVVSLVAVGVATPADMFSSCVKPMNFMWAWRLGPEIQRVKQRPLLGRLGIFEVPDDFIVSGKRESADCIAPVCKPPVCKTY